MSPVHIPSNPQPYEGTERRNRGERPILSDEGIKEQNTGIRGRLIKAFPEAFGRTAEQSQEIAEEIISEQGLRELPLDSVLHRIMSEGGLITFHQDSNPIGVPLTDRIINGIRESRLHGYARITRLPGLKLHSVGSIPPAKIPWANLTFASDPKFSAAEGLAYFQGGEGNKWSEGFVLPPFAVERHGMSQVDNYGAGAFEASKVFIGQNGEIYLFRIGDNARRMQHSAKVITIPKMPEELFIELVKHTVLGNIEYLRHIQAHPEIQAELYIRVTMNAVGAHHSIGPYRNVDGQYPNNQDLFTACVTVVPVANIFGKTNGIDAIIFPDVIRTGKGGVGHTKYGGNYAQTYGTELRGRQQGFQTVVYLKQAVATEDTPANERILGECKAAGLILEDQEGTIVTPNQQDGTILNSVTLRSLLEIADVFGIKVKQTNEISEQDLPNMRHMAFVGTAAVATPCNKLQNSSGQTHQFEQITLESNLGKIIHALKEIRKGNVVDRRLQQLFNAWLMQIGQL